MTAKQAEYICINEQKIQEQQLKLERLESRATYKDQRIDDIIKDNKTIEAKIDKLTDTINNMMLKSVADDNSLNQRVTALETDQTTTRYLLGLAIAGLAVLEFALKYVFN